MTSVANNQLQNDKPFENKSIVYTRIRHHLLDFWGRLMPLLWPKVAKVGNTVGDTTYIWCEELFIILLSDLNSILGNLRAHRMTYTK